MDTRVAVIGIIVEQPDSVEEMNHLLTQYGNYIIGRMGVPYEKKQISVMVILSHVMPDDVAVPVLVRRIPFLQEARGSLAQAQADGLLPRWESS